MAAKSPTPEKAFGDVLREIRLERGLSQEELAFACDRHRTYVSLLERGINSPSLRTIFRLADALGLDASEMIRMAEDGLKRPKRNR